MNRNDTDDSTAPGDFLSDDEDARRFAIIEASRAAEAGQLPQLFRLLECDSLANRRHIARALGNIGGEEAVSCLLRLLATEQGLMLGDIARSLGQLRVREAVPRLRELVQHRVEWVRGSAEWALAQIEGDA